MIPNEAIERAIEGGWKDLYALRHVNNVWVTVELNKMSWAPDDEGHDEQVHQTTQFKFEEIALDPTFWQALDKALGWSPFVAYKNGKWIGETEDNSLQSDTPFRLPNWLWKMHGFVDVVATKGDIKKFWSDLLNIMRDQNLKIIRKACIAANPAKDWEWQGDYYAAPFTLADVLVAAQPLGIMTDTAKKLINIVDVTSPDIRWNPRKDDINDQSDPTLQFLAGLLEKK